MIWKATAVIGLLLASFVAQADTYPSKPIRVTVPFGAGGVADITVRLVTEKMGDRLGQRFVIENLPGAGGGLAAQRALAAPADGYTLALFSNGTAVSVPLFKALPFDPVKDFVPVSTMGQFDFVLAANGASAYRSLSDFIKAAQARPGALNVGTINVGSTQHLSGLLFASEARIKVVAVPFRTTPDAMVGLLRNDVDLVIDSYASLKSGLDDKRLTALATTGATRSVLLPQTPTVADQGVRSFDVTSWNALFARTGTPPEVIALLNRTMRDVLAEDGLKKRLLELGIEARASTPEELGKKLKDDIARWTAVIQAADVPKQ
ncbi:tripartite tricarboxylate transporter substrate-binding protein [Ferrovibrio terrae]|uniref:Bug family tripartite tricarboxylate transporter substrate binding protein n=1 Tax=Ferrovibrio terrae TaxID=2594003 RepID=UPI0031380985